MLAMVGLAAPGLLRLRLRTDGHALVPQDSPQVRHDRLVREEFHIDDPIAVVIRSAHPNGIFNLDTLRLIQGISDALQRIDGLRPGGVVSLATERIDRVEPGTLNFQRVLQPLPATEQDVQRVRREVSGLDIYSGTLVAHDGRAAAIYVGVPPGADRTAVRRAVEQAVSGARSDTADQIDVIGPPVAEMLLGTHILQDLGVPEALLGAPPDSNADATSQRGLDRLRAFVSRRVGLLPIALAVTVVIFWASFRRAASGWLPLAKVGACLVFVFGLMGWCGVPVYLTITVMPVILTVTGMAGEIHILGRCAQLVGVAGAAVLPAEHGRAGAALVASALDDTWRPTLKSGITTGIGFLSFALSPLTPVAAFGVFTAIGIAFCMIWSLTVLPAVLALQGPMRFVRQPQREAGATHVPQSTLLERVARPIVRHPYAVAFAVVVLAVVSIHGVQRVVVQDSWIDGFAERSAFYQATQGFNEQFAGTHVLLVCVDSGSERLSGELHSSAIGLTGVRLPATVVPDPQQIVGWMLHLAPPQASSHFNWSARIESATPEGDALVVTTARRSGSPTAVLRGAARPETVGFVIAPERMKQPGTLERIESLERFIGERRDDAVGGVLGPARYVATTNYLSRARRESENRLPSDEERIAQAWKRFEMLRGAERLRQVVDPQFSRGLITVFLKNANFVDTQRLMDAIRAYERDQLTPHGIALSFAGDVAVSQTLIDAIVTTQVRSLLGSLASVVLVAALLGRSLGWGIYCAVPAALAVLLNFAFMGWTGMPLGVATSMFAAMTLGIGDDFAIHFLERYRLLRQRGAALDQALTQAVGSAGPPIVVDALAVALGFGTLAFSQVPANARLGGLVTLSLASCLAASLVLLPVLLRLWRPKALS